MTDKQEPCKDCEENPKLCAKHNERAREKLALLRAEMSWDVRQYRIAKGEIEE
jgi:hypothetical protein